MDMSVTDALKNVRNKWGLWLAEMDSSLGITNFISRGIVKLTDIVLDYPKIIAGKLPLIVSLLIEVVRGDVTSNMVFPLVKVVIGLECHV